MSNTIAVRVKGKVSYYPFRWDGDTLLVYVHKQWQAVRRTEKKNKYGDRIFELAG